MDSQHLEKAGSGRTLSHFNLRMVSLLKINGGIQKSRSSLFPFSYLFFFFFSHFFLIFIMSKYQSMIEPIDTSASSISSVPALSIFSDIGASLDEQRPLLTNTTQASSMYTTEICDEEPSATMASASINLSNTILGTGMLAMVGIIKRGTHT